MAKKFRLFRVSAASDDENASDRIDFNDPTNLNLKDAKKENAHLTEFKRISGHGVGDDQPAEEDLGSIDATGEVEDVYVITATITNTRGASDDGNNAFLQKLDTWNSEDKINGTVEWPEGRFGIIDDTDHTNDIIPVRTGSNQKGLIWESYTKTSKLRQNVTEITIRLRASRGDGT